MERHENKKVNLRTKQNKAQQKFKKHLVEAGCFLICDIIILI